MTGIDIGIIVGYFVVVLGLGFWYQRLASRNLKSYFLGGKSLHWLALSMSGSVATFDITGTMWIISLIVLMGMKSLWIHWMWGVMMGAFFMAYIGKWVRRSNVMTAAEWMITRFGNDPGGRLARSAYALMAVVTLASFIGYAFQGIGKFGAEYLPISPTACALIVIGTTTVYVMAGGLYSVVITNVIQTVILTLAGIVIAVLAYVKLSPEALGGLPEGWGSLLFKWQYPELKGDGFNYEFLGALVIVWVLKGLLLNSGGPAQMYDFQLFLASRNPRDAAKAGASWSFFLIIRWAMCAGIALMALTGISGITDHEKAMPIVLRDLLPTGIRGFVLAGFLAAFMSTFSSTVNAGASFIVRDFWQPYFRRDADQKQLVFASYVATLAIVLVGIGIGFQAESIAHIWNWMMMALGAAVIVPNALRWYWWRINGWGYAAGTLGGLVLSAIPLIFQGTPEYVYFPPIVLGSLIVSVVVSLATKPVDAKVLASFYRTVRPFGFWGPVKAQAGLTPEELSSKSESPFLAVFNTIVGIAAVTGYYLFPMYLVGHWHVQSGICLAVALVSTLILYFTWYRNLVADEPVEEPAD